MRLDTKDEQYISPKFIAEPTLNSMSKLDANVESKDVEETLCSDKEPEDREIVNEGEQEASESVRGHPMTHDS